MKAEKTNRGFDIINFEDRNGNKCSLQKSSIATEDCIWLGCDDADPKVLKDGRWQSVEMPEEYIANTRMHLSREQAEELLPYLVNFVNSGDLT